jgi:TPR repeat protein
MSSPIHHAEDLDAALAYAPPWAREQATPLARMRAAPTRMRLGPASREFSGDRAMIELQRQLALDPDGIPEPPAEDIRSLWPIVLRLAAVTGIAAIVAWGMVALTGPRKAISETVQADAPPLRASANQVKLVHFQAPAIMPPLVPDRLADASPPPSRAAPSQAASSQAESWPSQTAALPAPALPAIAAGPASNGLILADDEIATLIKRGQDLLQSGDLVSARLLLRRAAEAGNANAALALGATFDPLVIRRLGVIGIEPDAERARKWYQKAAELGSADASQQLAKLEQAH